MGCHDAKLVHSKVCELLDEAFFVCKGRRTTKSFKDVKLVTPRVDAQSGTKMCGLIVIHFMVALISERRNPYTKHDFQTGLNERVTHNTVFRFDRKSIEDLRKDLNILGMQCASIYKGKNDPLHSGRSLFKIWMSDKATNQKKLPKSSKVINIDTANNDEEKKLPKSPLVIDIDISDNDKETTLAKSTADAVKKRSESERKKEERRKQYYMKLSAELGILMNPLCIEYWHGTQSDGCFKTAVQTTRTCPIRVYGGSGTVVIGCIVWIDLGRGVRVYRVIEAERIRRKVSVHHGNYICMQETGFIKFGSSEQAMVVWRREIRWLNKVEINPLEVDMERKKRSPDRLSYDKIGGANDTPAEHAVDPREVAKFFQENFQNDGKRFESRDPVINRLLCQGDVVRAIDEAHLLLGRARSDTGEPIGRTSERKKVKYANLRRDSNANEIIKLTLIYELVRGLRGEGHGVLIS